jgi:hypothetical protein
MSSQVPRQAKARSHLLIAGTGRAGTSFLVRYLTQLGLDTTLSRRGQAGGWDEEAHAGLEELPVSAVSADLPYVIKSPWAYEVAQDMLADPALRLDAVILPMRDIVEAAASRTVLELRAMHEKAPWMADLSHSWETWCHTAGGTVYSLSPVDQARLLAMGFHRLVDRLTASDVPMLFLNFPRFVADADYLYERLQPVLPPAVTREAARAAHAALADGSKVRMGQELADVARPAAARSLQGPSLADLDRIALSRELARRRREMARLERTCSRLESRVGDLQVQLGQRITQWGLKGWMRSAAGIFRRRPAKDTQHASSAADRQAGR